MERKIGWPPVSCTLSTRFCRSSPRLNLMSRSSDTSGGVGSTSSSSIASSSAASFPPRAEGDGTAGAAVPPLSPELRAPDSFSKLSFLLRSPEPYRSICSQPGQGPCCELMEEKDAMQGQQLRQRRAERGAAGWAHLDPSEAFFGGGRGTSEELGGRRTVTGLRVPLPARRLTLLADDVDHRQLLV